jgi:hypothetical protein
MLIYNEWLREFRMGERLERFGWNAERFARNDSNGKRNVERFARNNWNSEWNAERFARNSSNWERNAERFARNDWNGERNAERLHGTILWCSSTLQGL